MNMKMVAKPLVMIGVFASIPLIGCTQDLRSEPLPVDTAELFQQHRYQEAYPGLDRAAKQQNQMAQFLLANYYVCGRVVRFSCSKARELFTASSKPSDSDMSEEIVRRAKNEIAWINAACEEEGMKRDIDLALKYATEAAQGGDPFSVDSLAAVQARQGDYAAAISNQKRAIELLNNFAESDTVQQYTFEEFSKRLALYQQHKPASFNKDTALENCNALP